MPSGAAQQFIESAERSGLMAPATGQEALALLTIEGAVTTDKLAEHLVEKKVLTAYQVERLIAGKGEDCVIAGRYHVLDKLGEGGMGAVYKARDTKLERVVAVKVLPPGRLHDSDAVARFQREAKALARLSHPHIIQAFDSGDERGRHFLVMEYVEGVTLDKVLRQHGALAPTLAADLIHQTALGLQHAHEKGLIHRDLKPANLLVACLTAAPRPSMHFRETLDYPATPSPQRLKSTAATVKILDLGLARFLQDQLGDAQITQEGAGMGTPDYMAPEQFRDALHADVRTDIYGLGCTLYHLIAGQVPFPGTSFSEKAHAHAKKEPIPLEERCPEVPAGLAFIVQKMMAKHPAERYQSAGEVAEALAPYVAGSSHSVIRMRETGRWPPGQLTMLAPRRATRALPWVVGAAALVLSGLLLIVAWPRLFPPDAPNVDPAPIAKLPDPKPDLPKTGDPPKQEPPPKIKVIEPVKPKVVTIENGLTVAKDGTGQHTTISAALDKIQPGQTIRVLDDAVYQENVHLLRRERHAGLTLESPLHATLEVPQESKFGLIILNVPRVTVRGLHFRTKAAQSTCVGVGGLSPGTVLVDLACSAGHAPSTTGILLDGAGLTPEDEPLRISNCLLLGLGTGIRLAGEDLATKRSTPLRRALIRENRFEECIVGIWASGHLADIHVAGNRFWGLVEAGIRLERLHDGTKGILIANNTIKGTRPCIEITKPAAGVKDVEIRSNIIIGEASPDIQYAAKGQPLTAAWLLADNWRQMPRPAKGSPEAEDFVDSAKDSFMNNLRLESLNSREANFLRPAKDSPLAKAGAGGDLPSYVGAVPPEGAEPWDWQWTWDAVAHKRLTVSKDPKDGGRFRTIGAALKAVKPKMTIRVLDTEKYAEPLIIDDAKAHEGLVLEAPQRATLVLPEGAPQSLLLQGVANVRVRGFRFETAAGLVPREGGVTCFVMIRAGCPGLTLEELECKSATQIAGIVVLSAVLPPDADPIIVKKCNIHVGRDGIALSGAANAPVSRVLVVENRIKAGRGILIERAVHDVVVAGNLVSNGDQAGIQFDNPLSGMQRVLLANKPFFNNAVAVRIWRNGTEDKFENGQAELRGNILMASQFGDMLYYRAPPGTTRGDVKDSRMLLDLWRFGQNLRDLAGSDPPQLTPLAKDDRKLDPAWLVSRIATDSDFLRPKADSPLATGGAGGDLPAYVGAIPPEGVEPWDWSKTWKARTKPPGPK